jgi:endonuclease III
MTIPLGEVFAHMIHNTFVTLGKACCSSEGGACMSCSTAAMSWMLESIKLDHHCSRIAYQSASTS